MPLVDAVAALLLLFSQWLDVPYVAQAKDGCGAAAVAMVIQYWARQDPALDAAAKATERINDDLRPQPSGGIPGRELKAYFESRGFRVFMFSGETADLENHLRKGRPLIVCLGGGSMHYVVVAGIDGRSVWFNDPARGRLTKEDLGSFRNAWKASGNWALLAVPRARP